VLLRTGNSEFLEKLKKEVPPSLETGLQVPGWAQKRWALIWKKDHHTAEHWIWLRAEECEPAGCEKSGSAGVAGSESLARRSGRSPAGRVPLVQNIHGAA